MISLALQTLIDRSRLDTPFPIERISVRFSHKKPIHISSIFYYKTCAKPNKFPSLIDATIDDWFFKEVLWIKSSTIKFPDDIFATPIPVISSIHGE